MKAQHTTVTSTYQNILNNIIENNPSFVHLDLSELHLTEEQLGEIASKIQSNNYIGNISWRTEAHSSDEFVQKIESRIVLNNQNYKHHPNDYIHGLFSSYAYRTSKENDQVKFELKEDKSENRADNEQVKIWNENLKEWKVDKVFSSDEADKYYSAVYINEQTKQIVLAHRGTDFSQILSDLLQPDCSFKTDLVGVLGGKIVPQIVKAHEATKYVTDYAKNNTYNLSITGHSLGAWLAELSVYFCHRDFEYHKVKAVTFDSPGSVIHIESFAFNVINRETNVNINNLDITTYLSAPNLVNSCNKHVGEVYRLSPQIDIPEFMSKVGNKIGQDSPFYKGLASVLGHSLTPLLATFDPKTGKPTHYEKILDWPVIKYIPREQVQFGSNMISTAIEQVKTFFIPQKIKDIASSINNSTLVSLVAVLKEVAEGKIDQKQYIECFKYLEANSNQAYPPKKELHVSQEFSLLYEGHYKITPINLQHGVMATDNKGSSDWCLKQLTKLSDKEINKKEIPNLVKKQLTALKGLYEIKPEGSKYYISTKSPNIKVEDLREQIIRLSEISNEAKKILEDSNAYTPIKPTKAAQSINSNLPPLAAKNLIPREDVLQKIEKTLSTEQCVVISAFPGTGKSTIATEYGHRQKDKPEVEKIVRFINADAASKISEAYRKLAEELGVNVESKTDEAVISLVHNKIINLKQSILFIFDNVDEYKDIAPYLNDIMNISKNKVQVIITARNNNLNNNIENIKLEPFSKQEAISYVEKSLGSKLSKQDTNNLIEELGSKDAVLPYSLSKAVAYLKDNQLLKVNDYIKYLKDSKDDGAETALLLQLLEKSPMAWQMLQYSAHLDPDFISIDIFKELLLTDEEKLQEPIKRLEALSVMNLTRQNEKDGLQLHRLVQTSVKKYIETHKEHAIGEKEIYTRIVEALDNLFPWLTNMPSEKWESSKIFYPHVIKILNDHVKIDKKEKQANLYQKLANYNDHILCKFEESLKYKEEALKMLQELYVGNHPSIAYSLYSVGVGYDKLGDTKKGLKYFELALKMRQELYVGNHPDIAYSLNSVGVGYSKLGDTKKGLKYLEEALKMRQELYVGNHPDIADSLYSVGVAYQTLGDTQKGLKYYEESLTMCKTLYGGNHPSIAQSLNSVGVAYQTLGDTQKGLKYYEESLTMYKALYVGNHPDIATSLNSVGVGYSKLGDTKKGLKYKEEALKMRQELYVGNHPDIADSLYSVGVGYDNLGDTKKGLKYFELALKMRQELYVGNHPDIAYSLNSVGVGYDQLGDTKKGLKYLEEALKMLKELYVGNHPDIARSLNNVNIARNKLKDYEETTSKVKQQILKELGKIKELSSKEEWSRGYFIKTAWVFGDHGVNGYIDDSYLEQQLGTLSNTKNIEIAKMLCFEAICLGAISSPNKNFTCVKEFAVSNLQLIEKIALVHPEYFINEFIARNCIDDPNLLNRVVKTLNPSGQGENNYEEVSYWNEYSKVAMEKMLELRLKAAGVDIEKENIKVISHNYVWDGYQGTAEKLVKEIITDLDTSEQILITLNLHNKHWVGIYLSKIDNEIKINYLDSEQNKIPTLLKNVLTEKIAATYPNFEVILAEKTLELQKSNNCGSEAVENLVFEVTGHRLDQENAVAVHSLLLEDSLLLGHNLTYS